MGEGIFNLNAKIQGICNCTWRGLERCVLKGNCMIFTKDQTKLMFSKASDFIYKYHTESIRHGTMKGQNCSKNGLFCISEE